MADRFYVNCELFSGARVRLENAEAHHLTTVRRFRPGDLVFLFNGDGREYPATLVQINRREALLEIGEPAAPKRELDFHLEVAAPLPKGDRVQFLIEKLTELGAARYVPLQTEHSVIAPREAKIDKLTRYVIEASKQCGRNVLMEVADVCKWPELCQSKGDAVSKILAHRGGEPLSNVHVRGVCTIAVGPEGGFTNEEIELGRKHAWQIVGLGPRTLRIETAAIALASRIAIGS